MAESGRSTPADSESESEVFFGPQVMGNGSPADVPQSRSSGTASNGSSSPARMRREIEDADTGYPEGTQEGSARWLQDLVGTVVTMQKQMADALQGLTRAIDMTNTERENVQRSTSHQSESGTGDHNENCETSQNGTSRQVLGSVSQHSPSNTRRREQPPYNADHRHPITSQHRPSWTDSEQVSDGEQRHSTLDQERRRVMERVPSPHSIRRREQSPYSLNQRSTMPTNKPSRVNWHRLPEVEQGYSSQDPERSRVPDRVRHQSPPGMRRRERSPYRGDYRRQSTHTFRPSRSDVEQSSGDEQHYSTLNRNGYSPYLPERSPELSPERERRQHPYSQDRGDYSSPRHYGKEPRRRREPFVKIPPFFGKEDWKVWINRFEVVAERQLWTDEEKLDYLLPKLQGGAGEFVFAQLPRQTLRCYSKLIREINSRFRVVETPKTFAAKFSRRDQHLGETAEEYAAELKALYDKAHRGRDRQTRMEDLVRRFLDGLKDDEIRCEVEYVKEPTDIDEAVYHVVNLIHTKRRKGHLYSDTNSKKAVRSANRTPQETEESDVSESDREDLHYPPESTTQPQEQTRKHPTRARVARGNESNGAQKANSMQDPEVMAMCKQMMEKISEMAEDRRQQPVALGKPSNHRQRVRCYSCNELGHFARDCNFNDRSRQSTHYHGDRKSWTGGQSYRRNNTDAEQRSDPYQREQINYEGQDAVQTNINQQNARVHTNYTEIVRRRRPLCDGIYLKGFVEEVPIMFTTDTGATKTIISERVYNRIRPENRPTLTQTACLTGAGGVPLQELGRAVFNIQLGPLTLQADVIVAEIEDEGLLGIDILQNGTDGPADILLSKGVIKLKGEEIPCEQVGLTKPQRRVFAAEHPTKFPGLNSKKSRGTRGNKKPTACDAIQVTATREASRPNKFKGKVKQIRAIQRRDCKPEVQPMASQGVKCCQVPDDQLKMQEVHDAAPTVRGKIKKCRSSKREQLPLSHVSQFFWLLCFALVSIGSLLGGMFIEQNQWGDHLQFSVPAMMKQGIGRQFLDPGWSSYLDGMKTHKKHSDKCYSYEREEGVPLNIRKNNVHATEKQPMKTTKSNGKADVKAQRNSTTRVLKAARQGKNRCTRVNGLFEAGDVWLLVKGDKKGTERLVHHNEPRPYEGDNSLRGVIKARKMLRVEADSSGTE